MSFISAAFVTLVLSALSVKAVSFKPVKASKIVQCETIKLSYKGHAPFIVSVWDGCNENVVTDTPKEDYHTNLTTVYWKVNVAAGQSIMFGVEDSLGTWAWTDDYPVKASNDSSCVHRRPSFSDTPTINPTTTTTTANTSTSTGTYPTTSPSLPTTQTKAPGNAGGYSTTSTTATHHLTHSGALSNLSPRVELAALVVAGSSLTSLLF